MLKLKRNLLSVALASATMLVAVGAQAQAQTQTTEDQAQTEAAKAAKAKQAKEEAAAAAKAAGGDATNLDRVVVTGIRRGIEDAIDTKKSATSIVESVSAEDIGKLPDSSIAESIARLPGLTAQRERGRAAQINIRGLSGDFAGTTLNGREQTTTGENRGVEFDQFPSELLSGVVVYKTPDATLVGQGLAGTVDLRTVRPLSFPGRVVTGNYRADQNRNNSLKEYGNRYSFSYIDQFFDRKLGFAIGYAHLDSPAPGFQEDEWGYAGAPGFPGVSVLGGGGAFKFDDRNKRDGVMATLQFKPNEFYETSVDLFYSKFKRTEFRSGVQFGSIFGGGVLQPNPVVSGSTITDATFTNIKPVIRNDSNPINDKLRSIGWNNKFTLNEHWRLNTDLSYSKTDRHLRNLETYAGLKNGATTSVRILLDPSGQFHQFTFGTDLSDPNNLVLTDPNPFGQDGYLKDFNITDKIKAYRLDATRSFDAGALSSINFGVNRTDRTKTKSSAENKLCLNACNDGATAPFPGSSSSLNFGGLDNLALYNAETLLNSGAYNFFGNFYPQIAAKNWEVNETVDTFFTQGNINTDMGSVAVRGNFGFQYVKVRQDSTGFDTFTGNPAGTPVTAGASYSDILPSMNLSLGFAGDQYLRFAVARQMARPRLDDMKAGLDVSISAQPCTGERNPMPGAEWCGGGGNPQLKPWLANALDVSYEKYFTTEAGNKGYLSAAYFYKDLKTYIYRQNLPFDYAGYPLPAIQPGEIVGVTYPASTVGVINQPANGQGGTLKGTELTASLPFDALWGRLNGFGVQASYSNTMSSIAPNGPGTTQPLPGLSKYVSNVTLYYERYGFSARVSRRSRSAFYGETRGLVGGDNGFIAINGETVEDAQLNYTFGDGRLAGLSLYLQVSNIGDAPFSTSNDGDPSQRPVQYFKYGRTTLAGFSYKF